jgi:hypothetical protein
MSEKWIDQSWKQVLTENLDDAIAFFMPALAADRDHLRKITPLRDEHPAIAAGTDRGMRVSDLCFEVPLMGGREQRVALFVEQQHWRKKNFALGMFQEYYRMSDDLKMPVTALAILTGKVRAPSVYVASCYGTELSFKFNDYQVADADPEALRRDGRPFALVVLAARRMLDAGESPENRGKYSLELLDLMRERGHDDKKTRSIQRFTARILRLNDARININVKEEWKMMRRITMEEAIEEIQMQNAREEGLEKGLEEGLEKGLEKGLEEGLEKGLEKGLEEGLEKGKENGKVEMARNLLDNGVPPDIIAKSAGMSWDSLRSLMN